MIRIKNSFFTVWIATLSYHFLIFVITVMNFISHVFWILFQTELYSHKFLVFLFSISSFFHSPFLFAWYHFGFIFFPPYVVNLTVIQFRLYCDQKSIYFPWYVFSPFLLFESTRSMLYDYFYHHYDWVISLFQNHI